LGHGDISRLVQMMGDDASLIDYCRLAQTMMMIH